MTENEALAHLRAGDADALGWFIDRYAAYAATIVNNIMLPALSPSDAEEALSDVFVALWRAAGRVGEGNVRQYIAGTARRRALDALRRRRVELPLDGDVLSLPGESMEHALTERELAGRARTAVDAMSEPDREIFLRHYFYAQSVADIALALDMNANTVKTRLRRGREKLKAELTKGDD